MKNLTVIKELNNKSKSCECAQWESLCVIEMTKNTCDYIFSLMEKIKKREEPYWWLYLLKCKICNEYWLVAQEERIIDCFCLNRLNLKQANDIIENNIWPNIYDRYEDLLKIGIENNIHWYFLDPINDSPLGYTIEELAIERPFIKISELSKLLNINIETALLLSKRVIENNAAVKITFDV